MTMARVVAAETLDNLAADDPAAMRSRRDLQRVHRMMGTRQILVRALRKQAIAPASLRPLRILELGAGDGSLMLGVAHRIGKELPAVELTLLDRQALVSGATRISYRDAGWRATALVCDVFDWVGGQAAVQGHARPQHWDLIVCNLFLHHFEGAQLQSLLGAIQSRTERFFACEPRRARLALAASHLVGAIGGNAVTREDAVLSVHAGFQATELSQAWPAPESEAEAATVTGWMLDEYSAGLFSHCFYAERRPSEAAAAA